MSAATKQCMEAESTSERVACLWKERPRSRFLTVSVWTMVAGAVYAWLSGNIQAGELFSERRRSNLERFLTEDATPYPLRNTEWGLAELWDWSAGIVMERGWEAMSATLWIATLAIVLAGVGGLLLAPLGASSLIQKSPYLLASGSGKAESDGRCWRCLSVGIRLIFILLRAIPEYIWAFLLLAMLGPSAWPAVLALAIHNSGILGRLGSDTIENLEHSPLRSLRMLGASRKQLAVSAIFPLALPRYLLYFFYRFETCIREATVLGMLGVVSLGYWIGDARARGHYDELILLILLSASLVLLCDLASQLARAFLRRGA